MDDVPICVPSISGKPVEVYNYLGRRGVAAITAAINNLFTLDLWHSLAPRLTGRNLNNSIEDWCRERGISLDNREAVRQRFFRMRKAYETHGVVLGKKCKSFLGKSL